MSWFMVAFPCIAVHTIAELPSSAVVTAAQQHQRPAAFWLAAVRCQGGAALKLGTARVHELLAVL
jgi:hypothetical protein